MIQRNVSFTDYRTRSINDDNLRIQAQVLNLYPNSDVSEKDYSGLTITINGEKIDFYRKAFKYHVHSCNQWVKMKDGMLFKDAIMASLKQILEKEEQLINPEPKVAHIEPQVPETSNRATELKTTGLLTPEQTLDWHVQEASDSFDANYRQDCIDAIEAYHMQFARGLIEIPQELKMPNGVQSCIDHILKKREFIMQNQPDNKLAAFCLSLSKELEQYLP